MKTPLFQIDAFTSEHFSGNPAAVCILDACQDLGDRVQIAGDAILCLRGEITV